MNLLSVIDYYYFCIFILTPLFVALSFDLLSISIAIVLFLVDKRKKIMSAALSPVENGAATSRSALFLSDHPKVKFPHPPGSIPLAQSVVVQNADDISSSDLHSDIPKVLSRYAYMHNGRRNALRVYVEEENGVSVLRDLAERRDPLDCSQVDKEGLTLLHHMMLCPDEEIAPVVSLLELLLRRWREPRRYAGDIKPLTPPGEKKKASFFLFRVFSKGLQSPHEGEDMITLAIRRPLLWEKVKCLVPIGTRVQCLSQCYRRKSSVTVDDDVTAMDQNELALAAGLSLEVFQHLESITNAEEDFFHPLAVPYSSTQAKGIDDAIRLALTPLEKQREVLLHLYEGVRSHLKLYARAAIRAELVARATQDFESILSAIHSTMKPTNMGNIQTRRRKRNLKYYFLTAEKTKTSLSALEQDARLPFLLHSLMDALSGSDSRLVFQWYWRAQRYSVATWTEAHLQFRQDPIDAIQRWSYVVQSILLDRLQEATQLRSSFPSLGSANTSLCHLDYSSSLYRPLIGFSITGSSIAEKNYTGGIILGGLEPLTPAGDFLYLSPRLLESLLENDSHSSHSSTFAQLSGLSAKVFVEEAVSNQRQIWFHLRREVHEVLESSERDSLLPDAEERKPDSIYLEIFDRTDRLPSTLPVISIPLPSPEAIFSMKHPRHGNHLGAPPALMLLTIPEDDSPQRVSISTVDPTQNDRVILLFSSQYTRWSLPVLGIQNEDVKDEEQKRIATVEAQQEEKSDIQDPLQVESGVDEESTHEKDSNYLPTPDKEDANVARLQTPFSFSTFKVHASSNGKVELKKTQGYVIRGHLQTFPPPFSGECWTSDLSAVESFQAIGPAAEDLLSFISKCLYLPHPIRGKMWKFSRLPPLIELDSMGESNDDHPIF